MTALEAYQSFLIKLNKNDSNANINVPKGKFVILYNEHAKAWLEQKLKRKLGTNEISELSSLLVDNVKVDQESLHFDHVDYKLPSDFFDFSSSYSIAEKQECTQVLDNWPLKDKNLRLWLSDSNYQPSFEYEETLCLVSDNKFQVYFKDFKLKEVYLSYYRIPRDIDVSGYIKIDNTPSTDIDPDVPDRIVNQIINRCVLDYQGIVENKDGFEASKQRLSLEN